MLNRIFIVLSVVILYNCISLCYIFKKPESVKRQLSPTIQDSDIKAAVMILSEFPLFNSKIINIKPRSIKSNATLMSNLFLKQFIAGTKNVDVKLSFKELVLKYGYGFEHHGVTTDDGYLLSLFRIPSNGSVVFLMHGLLGSADDFIIAGGRNALAYMLAKNGYDVWLGNARGTKHSRRHFSWDPTQASFWDFSWHEIGIYDLPAMIDYVLQVTHKSTLKYIGHSQGTTSFFVMAAERPEFNKKVSLMVALAPVAFMSRVKSPIMKLLSPVTLKLSTMSKSLGVYEFLPDNELITTLKKVICGRGTLQDIICSNAIFLVFGCDYYLVNVTNLPVVFGHLPAGASLKQFAHYGQGLMSGEFRMFDYGSFENTERYGTVIPPRYKLSNIVTPISIFFGDSDWMADPQDVDFLCKRLKNIVDIYKVPFSGFNHLDFILARNVRKLVYRRVMKLLATFDDIDNIGI